MRDFGIILIVASPLSLSSRSWRRAWADHLLVVYYELWFGILGYGGSFDRTVGAEYP